MAAKTRTISLRGPALLTCEAMTRTDPRPLARSAILRYLGPGAVNLCLVTIWHWKERYRGKHSDLWGGLILIETTGWFKLVYLFRYIIPDARGTGRYASAD